VTDATASSADSQLRIILNLTFNGFSDEHAFFHFLNVLV